MMYRSWIVLVVACLLQETCAVSLVNTKHKAYLSYVIKSMHDRDAEAEHAAREQDLSTPIVDVVPVVEGADGTQDALSDVKLLDTFNDINERLSSLAESLQTVMENQYQITTRLSVLETAHEVDEASQEISSQVQESEDTQPPAPEVNQSLPDSIDAMQELLGDADELDLLGDGDVEQVVGNEEAGGQEEAATELVTVAPQATTIPPKTKPLAGDSSGQRSGQRPPTPADVEEATTAAPESESGNGENDDEQQQSGADQDEAQATTIPPRTKPVAGDSSGQRSGQRPPTQADVEEATTAAPESESGNEENDGEQQQSGADQDEAQDDKETEQGQQESQIATQPPPVATEPTEESDVATSPASIEGEQRHLGDYHRYSFRGYNHFTDARRDDLLRRIRINLSQRQVPLAPQPYVVRERVPLDKGGYRRPVSQT